MIDAIREFFDTYLAGSTIGGQGCWETWDNAPAANTTVSAAQSFTAPNSLLIAGGADIVVEAVGQPQAWSEAVAAVRRGGTVVLFGGLPRGDVPLDPYRIHYHELTLRGSYHHTPAAIREALGLLAGGAYPFAELLTHAYPLERVAEPLAQAAGLAEPDDRLLKAVIRP